jgi:serine/threonine protein phosphatase PrpC
MESARVFDHALDLPFVCIVADGMGGHNDGEQASLLVAKSLARRLPAFGPDKIASSVRAVNAELYCARRRASRAGRHGLDRRRPRGPRHSLTIFNVGDSRAYKIGEATAR